jgi:hypothetical protein
VRERFILCLSRLDLFGQVRDQRFAVTLLLRHAGEASVYIIETVGTACYKKKRQRYQDPFPRVTLRAFV